MLKSVSLSLSLVVACPVWADGIPPNTVPSDESSANTAGGTRALSHNTTGQVNTAFGYEALRFNTTGSFNTACGYASLILNTTGHFNTGLGNSTLMSNQGDYNTASGTYASWYNTTGSANTALGFTALVTNHTGSLNTAIGSEALRENQGSWNTALGAQAGALLESGSYNVYLAHPGVVQESRTIRIGSEQNRVFVAGIVQTPLTGGAVVVINKLGQLGVKSTRLTPQEQHLVDQIAQQERRLQHLEQLVTQLQTRR